jgi:hypothetical protein
MIRRVALAAWLVVAAASGATAIQSGFDAGLEGWTTDNTGALTHQPAGGNPDGFLQLDNDEAGIAHVFSPAAFEGDLSALDGTTLAFDGRLVAAGGGFYQGADDYGLVRITGGGFSASVDLAPSGQAPPSACWQTFSVPLTAAAFGVSQGTWDAILANVTEIRITIEALFGAEIEGVDNVCVGACSNTGTCGSTTSTSSSSSSSTSSSTSTSTTSTTATTGSSSTVPTTSSTSSSTAIGSTTSTTTAASTTTSTTLTTGCELLTGKKLLLKAKAGSDKRGLNLLSADASITLGGGNGGADDPVTAGGTLRVVTTAGDGFDDTYDLPAARWGYVKKEGANRGYKFRRTNPFKSILIQPGKRLKIVANGVGLGHTLGADPEPVDVVLRIGDHCYCLRFGGESTFKADKKWLAKSAPAPAGCPPAASPAGAFVD